MKYRITEYIDGYGSVFIIQKKFLGFWFYSGLPPYDTLEAAECRLKKEMVPKAFRIIKTYD